jgi:hypothetical protein
MKCISILMTSYHSLFLSHLPQAPQSCFTITNMFYI